MMIVIISLKCAWVGQQEYAEEPAMSLYDADILLKEANMRKGCKTVAREMGMRGESNLASAWITGSVQAAVCVAGVHRSQHGCQWSLTVGLILLDGVKFLDVYEAVFLFIATTLKYCLKIIEKVLKTDYPIFP